MPDLLTVTEVAHHLRVNPTTVRRWIHGGHLHAIILPHSRRRKEYRIRQDTLDALLREKPHGK